MIPLTKGQWCGAVIMVMFKDHFVYAPSQWEATLQWIVISRWQGTCTKWTLDVVFVISLNKLLKKQSKCCLGSRSWHSYDIMVIWKVTEDGWWINDHHRVVPRVSFNSLRLSDAIRPQGTESTLAQVMACCLTAPSHYLNQCWLIISKVLWHSSKGIIMRRSQDTNQ